jgi:peptidoglycan/LPS O-acetylase OafA/YrhL
MRLLVSDKANNFDAIRIAMALLVVWSHSFALYFGTEAAEPISLLTGGALNAGNIAVDVFFIVSGFLIQRSFERSKTSWSYLKKRIARIYPGFIVATSLCAFVLLPLYAGTRYTLGSVAKTLGLNLLLQGWFVNPEPFVHNHGHPMNGSLWSIPFEFWCYLGVLALGLLRLRRVHVLAAFIVIIGIQAYTNITGRVFGGGLLGKIVGWPNLWFRMAPLFMAGMLVCLYREKVPRSGRLALLGLAFLVACARFSPIAADAVLPLTVGYAVFYWAFSRQLLQAAKYGDYSYGTYLYAFPIQQLLLALTSLRFPAFVIASMALSLLAGVASWFLVERWFHRTREPIAANRASPLVILKEHP